MFASKSSAGRYFPFSEFPILISMDLRILIYFGISIVAGTIVFTEALVDAAVLPRFLIISALLLVSPFLFFKETFKSEGSKVYWLDLSLLLFYLINFASVAWATNPQEAIYESQKIFLLVGVYFMTRSILQIGKVEAIKALAYSSLVLTVIILAYVGYELLTISQDFELNKDTKYLVKGFSSHRNILGGTLMILIPFNLMGWVMMRKKAGPLFLGATAIQLALLFFLGVRSVYLICIALAILGSLLWFVVLPSKKKQLLANVFLISAGAVAVLLFILFISGQFTGIISGIDVANLSTSKSGQERIVLWEKSSEMARDHLLTGVGTSNWRIESLQYGVDGLRRAEENNVNFNRPHNDWIWIIAETGIIGFFSFLAALGLALWSLVQALVRSERPGKKKMLLLVFSGLMSYMVFSTFSFPRERPEFLAILGVFLALTYHLAKDQLPALKFTLPANGTRAAVVLCVLLAGFNLILGTFRFQGESNAREVFLESEKKNWARVKTLAENGTNPFYNIAHWGDPIAFHEGVALVRLGQVEAAKVPLEHALTISPHSYKVKNNLGVVYFNLGDMERGEELVRSASETNPGYDDASYNLAVLEFQNGNFPAARELVMRLDPTDARRQTLLQELEKKGAN